MPNFSGRFQGVVFQLFDAGLTRSLAGPDPFAGNSVNCDRNGHGDYIANGPNIFDRVAPVRCMFIENVRDGVPLDIFGMYRLPFRSRRPARWRTRLRATVFLNSCSVDRKIQNIAGNFIHIK